MDVLDLSNDSLKPNDEKPNQASEESCILVEEDISTIEIDDTIVDDSEIQRGGMPNDVAALSPMQSSELSPGELQENDVAESSENAGSQEAILVDAVSENTELTEPQNEFCAPNNVDLDVTPLTSLEAPEPSKLLIDIKFQNKKTYLAFQEEFVAIIKNYYKSKIDDMSIVDDMSSNRIRVSEKRVKQSDTFLIDKTPSSSNLKSLDDEPTPSYRNSFGRIVLTNDKESEAKRKSNTSTPKNACFNCDKGGHNLRDCPEPRNMKKVNKARNEFNRKELRYHDDNENEYGNLVPGVITNDLKAALGLSGSQIPLHVYRMRLLGYPPAWIEEAKIHNSGLSLFVEKDRKQLQPGVDDGEMEDNDFKYDVQKIFEYPGFNVPADQPFLDLYRMYNVPPMMPQHSKEELIRSLGDVFVNGYKKTKLKRSEIVDMNGTLNCSTDKTTHIISDMEIEDVNIDMTLPLGVTVLNSPALPSNSFYKPPEPMEDGELSNDSRSRSPCENDLKEQRKALLAEIAESSVFLDTSSINSTLNITSPNTSTATINQSQLNATIIENSENENRDNCAKDIITVQVIENERAGHVDDTIFGCPVLPSFSPFNILPAGEKFQEGVCDVIAFENLAESTGKYEKMKTLIKKVRTFQQEHQKE